MQVATENHSKTGIAVDLQKVTRVYPGPVPAVDAIDLRVEPGEFLAILGPSGCGKSTLLRIIAGLDRPDGGSVTLTGHATPTDGAALDRASSQPLPPGALAYVFQDAHLLPWRNVLRNVELPLELMRIGRATRRDEAMRAIEQVGLADAIKRYPAQLSGGMRMRVSLARALVTNPDLLLLDEPFAALDEITRHQLDEQLHHLWVSRRMTVIFVTHSIVEATFLAQRAIVLTPRPARIVLDHKLDLPQRRDAQLRTDLKFSRQMRILFEALERGEARRV
jgi:NitT/TauT family transport system ATP-binding protein